MFSVTFNHDMSVIQKDIKAGRLTISPESADAAARGEGAECFVRLAYGDALCNLTILLAAPLSTLRLLALMIVCRRAGGREKRGGRLKCGKER